jgi:hypothetical protein
LVVLKIIVSFLTPLFEPEVFHLVIHFFVIYLDCNVSIVSFALFSIRNMVF